MASSTTSRFTSAKASAVARFLSKAAPPPEFAALTASTKHRDNIVGVGIGPKVTNGRDTRRLAIRFYVERKVAKGAVPKKDLLPSSINGVATDVIETGRFFAFTPIAQQRLRPAKGGCSCGFQASGFVMAGTLGCLVTDGTSRFILSNNHVLADENSLPIGSPIFQPGLLDSGNAVTDRIAKLSKFVTIKKLPAKNTVDCAIAKLDSPKLCLATILPKIGKLGSATTIAAAVGMRVHKHGRTTGYTRGHVVDVAADVNISYDFGTARFVDQILIVGNSGQFSDAGDSGSLIVDRTTKRATGLLFAGSSSHTIANQIGDVLSELGVTLAI